MRIYKTVILGLSLLALAGCSSWQSMCPDNGFQYRICPPGKAQPTAKELADRIAALEKERQRLEAALASANQQTAALTTQLGSVNQQTAGLTTQTQVLESQLAERDRELAALRGAAGATAAGLTSQLSSAQGDLAQSQARTADLERQLATTQASSSSERERLAAELAAAQAELAAAQAGAQSGAADKNKLAADLAAANQRITDLETQLAALGSTAADKDKLAADLAISRQRLAELDQQLAERAKELAERDKELAERDKEVTGLRGDLSAEMAKLKAAQRSLIRGLRPQIEKGDIMVDLNNERLLINLASSYLFGLGEDQLKPAGADALRHVAAILKDFPEYKVAVDGHTDNLPIRRQLKKKFPTNQELSEARAANAAKALAEGGLAAATTTGYADTRPVATNTTDAGRAKNRRVEVRVTK